MRREHSIGSRPQPTGLLGRGALVSLLLHAQLLVPLLVVTWVYADREQARRADEVDVSFAEVPASELPADLPPLEPLPPPRRADARRTKKEAAPPTEAAPAAPEEEIVAPPMPPMPEEKPPDLVEKRFATPVDLDMGRDVPAPADAKYLAQKNNRAEVETRAIDTVLDRAQEGVESSSPSQRQHDRIGDDVDRPRIAETEDRPAQLGRRAPEVTPHVMPQPGRAQSEPSSESLLAMRAVRPRPHEITPETADRSLPHDPEGQAPEHGQPALPSPRSQAARLQSRGTLKLQLSGEDYEHVFGADAEAERRFAQAERTRRPGRFQERMGRMRAALENFIPEVRPGNQTALNTRAAPFAVYIARMHRSIHKLWGFGVLEDWDDKPAGSPFNRRDLATKLEIALNADGTIDKVTVVRNSGYLPYDAAAIDVVYSAGPYPDPPREIRSGNGKIYVHWLFRRDEYQCHPSGVETYILDNAAAGRDRGDAEAASRGMPSPDRAPRVPSRSGLSRLERGVKNTAGHRAKLRELDEAAGEEAPHAHHEPDPAAARQAAAQVARADDPAARAAAEAWFTAQARGDVAGMVRSAAFPFHSIRGVAAKTPAELTTMLAALADESPGKRPLRTLELYSAAGARGALGGLPPGFGDGTGLLFAVGRLGGDTFVLVLAPRERSWRPVGLVRR